MKDFREKEFRNPVFKIQSERWWDCLVLPGGTTEEGFNPSEAETRTSLEEQRSNRVSQQTGQDTPCAQALAQQKIYTEEAAMRWGSARRKR